MVKAFQFRQLSWLFIPLIFWLALAFRLWDLQQPFFGDASWNEAYYANMGRSFFTGNLLDQPDNLYGGRPVMSTPATPWLIFISFIGLGVSEWSARLPILFCGLFSLASLTGLARRLYGNRVAVLSLFLASFAPGIVFYSRNVQLDGLMVAAGLGALAAMVHYQKTKQKHWLVTMGMLFSLAIAAKYSAFLFWPALTWLWFAHQHQWRNWQRWARWLTFSGLTLTPSAIWVVIALSRIRAVTSAGAAQDYFLRSKEFTWGNWQMAFLSLWPRLYEQAGPVLLLSSLLLAGFLLFTKPFRQVFRAAIFPALLIFPWYAQLGYPFSWINNPYYEYPAVYDLAMLAALMSVVIYRWAAPKLPTGWLAWQWLAAGALAALYIGANFWAYAGTFHLLYYPTQPLAQTRTYDTAKYIAFINKSNDPILADIPMVLYYSEADLNNSRYAWWGTPLGYGATLAAIQSCKYQYLVFEYAAPPVILDLVSQTGYVQIGPGAWQKGVYCYAATP